MPSLGFGALSLGFGALSLGFGALSLGLGDPLLCFAILEELDIGQEGPSVRSDNLQIVRALSQLESDAEPGAGEAVHVGHVI